MSWQFNLIYLLKTLIQKNVKDVVRDCVCVCDRENVCVWGGVGVKNLKVVYMSRSNVCNKSTLISKAVHTVSFFLKWRMHHF